MFLEESKDKYLTFNLRESSQHINHIRKVQELTLNKNRPQIGLKGINGLYCSEEWWDNISQNKINHKFVSGIITRIFKSGQDRGEVNNSFELVLDNGEFWEEGIYVSNEEQRKLFQLGSKVEILYVFDELKSGRMLDIVIQMSISKVSNNKSN
ncbi:hypothetical protein A4G19_09100 [Pasteurellaceae bacterium Macca]|nr:hypothetical protein [Pasteurellaceae bacterium Macca]